MRRFNNSLVKGIILLFLTVCLSVPLCACNSIEDTTETAAPLQKVKFNIGVICTDSSEEYETAQEGFWRAFTEKDYEEDVYYSTTYIECEGSKAKCAEAAQTFVEEEVDLIFTIGEEAAVAAAEATQTIPVIFCCVADPIEAGLLTSCESPDKNVTGVSDFTPVEEQFAFIKSVIPDAKKVTSLHFSTDANSILVTNMAKSAAESLSLEYTPYSASDSDKLEKVLESAMKDTDALYICEDELTIENADIIIEAANEKKVPVFSATDTFMSFGAFATCLPDYEDLGFNAGELALICLKELHPISNISVEYPVECIGYISRSVADTLEIDVSEDGSVIFVD